MPEGDTIFRLARRLDAALAGQRVVRSSFRVARFATADLAGARTTEVASRGKHLLHRFDSGVTLHTHLRMSGSWRLSTPGARWSAPAWKVRVVLECEDVQALAVAMPVVELVATRDERRVVGHLGPDLLGDWDPEEALGRLRAAPARPLVHALLDQRNLAGLGNLYAVEGAFLARTSPWTPVGEVAGADLEDLLDRLARLLAANARTGRQVTTGDDRRGRTHWVYGRYGRACARCGTTIDFRPGRGDGRERETWWCPGCQPGPAPPPPVSGPAAARPRR